jgi:hypothetical protein
VSDPTMTDQTHTAGKAVGEHTPGPIEAALIAGIAADLEGSIANLGYPVGCGMSPSPEACVQAATSIVARIRQSALNGLSAETAISRATGEQGQ